jgi:hypothetical protein
VNLSLENYEVSLFFLDHFNKKIYSFEEFFSLDLPSLLSFLMPVVLDPEEVLVKVRRHYTLPPELDSPDSFAIFLRLIADPPGIVKFNSKILLDYAFLKDSLSLTIATRGHEFLIFDGIYELGETLSNKSLFWNNWELYGTIQNKHTGFIHRVSYESISRELQEVDQLHSWLGKVVEGLPQWDGYSYAFAWFSSLEPQEGWRTAMNAEGIYNMYRANPRLRELSLDSEEDLGFLNQSLLKLARHAEKDISSYLEKRDYKAILEALYADRVDLQLPDGPCTIYAIKPYVGNLIYFTNYAFFIAKKEVFGIFYPKDSHVPRHRYSILLIVYTSPNKWVAYQFEPAHYFQPFPRLKEFIRSSFLLTDLEEGKIEFKDMIQRIHTMNQKLKMAR